MAITPVEQSVKFVRAGYTVVEVYHRVKNGEMVYLLSYLPIGYQDRTCYRIFALNNTGSIDESEFETDFDCAHALFIAHVMAVSG